MRTKTLLDMIRIQLMDNKKNLDPYERQGEGEFRQGYNEALNDVYEEIGLIIDKERVDVDVDWPEKCQKLDK